MRERERESEKYFKKDGKKVKVMPLETKYDLVLLKTDKFVMNF